MQLTNNARAQLTRRLGWVGNVVRMDEKRKKQRILVENEV
jgi:hypothetical protein